jgi:hypothetical protein
MPSVTVSWLLQAAPKTLAINAKFGQPELDSNPLSSGHDVVPLRRQGQLATPENNLGTDELVLECARLAIVRLIGHSMWPTGQRIEQPASRLVVALYRPS